MEKTIRVTKAQRFEDIIAMLNGEGVKYGTTTADAVGVLNHEIELLAKKNTSVDKRKLAENAKNEALAEAMLAFVEQFDEGVTCADVIQRAEGFNTLSTSKVASLFKLLKNAGKVRREEIKGKARFFAV